MNKTAEERIKEQMNLLPDNPTTYERGLYDGYLNSLKWLEEYRTQSSKRMKAYVPLSSSIEPEKEGRYLVSNGLVWFEVNWDKQYGFHAEFTDCSGITTWLKETELCVLEEGGWVLTFGGFMQAA